MSPCCSCRRDGGPAFPLLRCQTLPPNYTSYGIFRGGCRTPSKTPPSFTLHRAPTPSRSRGCKAVSISNLWLLIFPSLCPPGCRSDLKTPRRNSARTPRGVSSQQPLVRSRCDTDQPCSRSTDSAAFGQCSNTAYFVSGAQTSCSQQEHSSATERVC